MYIPKDFQTHDRSEIVAFMKQYSFATIITSKDNYPTATHLPFIISEQDGNIILQSHFGRSNHQWSQLADNPVLVIFTEPHAYISPKHYENRLSVPTWNYISIHTYGQAKLITEEVEIFKVLEASIENYEIDYKKQWESLPMDWKVKMAKGIVAFEIVITNVQAKKKLSQNKSELEQRRIIETLSNSKNTNEQDIGKYMSGNLTV